MKASPACAGLPAPLVIVKVSTEVEPGAIEAGLKALVSAGDALTVRVAERPVADRPGDRPEMLPGRLL